MREDHSGTKLIRSFFILIIFFNNIIGFIYEFAQMVDVLITVDFPITFSDTCIDKISNLSD